MRPDATIALQPLGLLVALIGAIGLSLVLVRVGMLVSHRAGLVANPNPIVKTHTRPVAYGGGVAVVVVSILLTTIFVEDRYLLSLLSPVAIGLVVGVIDDVIGLRPATKLIGQSFPAILYIALVQPPLWAMVPICLFLVICQNAWNLIDVMDGLLGSTAALAFLGIAAIAYTGEGLAGSLPVLAVVTAGASVGFLWWNMHPARVYMGDSGSLPLGLLYGIIVLELLSEDVLLGSSALLVGTVPFFEFAFLIIVRWRKGIKVYRGSPDHFSMRMQCAGLTIPTVLKRVVVLNTAIVLVSVALVLVPDSTQMLALAAVGVAVLAGSIAISRYLYRLPVWGGGSK